MTEAVRQTKPTVTDLKAAGKSPRKAKKAELATRKPDVPLDFSKAVVQTQAYLALLGPDAQQGARVALAWGRGIGKSWFHRVVWWLLIAHWDGVLRPGASSPGIRIVLLMPTLQQARKVHVDLILAELQGEWAFLGGKLNQGTWRITFPGGSWIQIISSVRAHLVRGIRCDFVSVDEADDIEKAMIDSIVNPWFSEPWSLRFLLLSGTPRMGRKGLLWEAFHEWPKKNAKFIGLHATAYDAPQLVDPTYLAEVKDVTPPSIFDREWMCNFDAAEGIIYSLFWERFHIREPGPDQEWDDFFYCADHGYTDPGVILGCGVIGRGADAVVWAVSEVYETEKDPVWWEETAVSRIADYPDAKWYPDPARPDINSLWRKRGANIRKVEKGPGSVLSGIGFVQRYLKVRSRLERQAGELVPVEYARLFVSRKCPKLIGEMGLYRRKRKKGGGDEFEEEPEDKDNHALDALRYGITTHFPDAYRAHNDRSLDGRQAASE